MHLVGLLIYTLQYDALCIQRQKELISLTTRCHSEQNLLSSCLLPAKIETEIHKALILSVVCVECFLEYVGKYRVYLKTVCLGEHLCARIEGQ